MLLTVRFKKFNLAKLTCVLFYLILCLSSTFLNTSYADDVAKEFKVTLVGGQELKVDNKSVMAQFLIEIPKNHYIYKDSLEVTTQEGVVPSYQLPDGVAKYDPFLEKEAKIYTETFVQEVTLVNSWRKGDKINFIVSLQGCGPNICYAPKDYTLTAVIPVDAVTANQEKPSGRMQVSDMNLTTAPQINSSLSSQNKDLSDVYWQNFKKAPLKSIGDFSHVIQLPWYLIKKFSVLIGDELTSLGNKLSSILPTKSTKSSVQLFFIYFMVSLVMGLITALTPCVYPIIPLTWVFLGVSKDKSELSLFQRGKVYFYFTTGILLASLTTGLITVLFQKTFGFIYQSEFVTLGLGLLNIFLAFWFFGIIKLQIPAQWQTKVAQMEFAGPMKGIFAGATIGVFAAPCVLPAMGILLTIVNSGEILQTFFVFAGYGLGMGVMFILVALLSRTLFYKIGRTSRFVKIVMFLILFANGSHYIYIFIDDNLLKTQHVSVHGDGGYFMSAEDWLKQNAPAHKPVFVDYGATWCVYCVEFAEEVLSKPDVKEYLLEHFIPVYVDCTEQTEACEKMTRDYKVKSFPTILVLDHKLKVVPESHVVGNMNKTDFMKYLVDMKSQDKNNVEKVRP